MGRSLGIFAAIAAASVISFLAGIQRGAVEPQDPDTPTIPAADSHIAALGRLEPLHGIINVSALPGDLIDEVKVVEGQEVAPKQTLVTLKSRQLRELEKELATARLDEARQRIDVEQEVADARLEAAKLSAREATMKQQDLNREEANLELLHKQAVQARRTLQRLQSLAADPVTSEATSIMDIEKQSLLVEKLESDEIQGKAALASARKSAKLAIEAADSQVKAATISSNSVEKASPLGALQRAVDLATLNWEMTNVVAPNVQGDQLRILRVMAKSGERVANMPLLQIGDVGKMACVAEVYEANLRDVEEGMMATLTSPALRTELHGVVVQKGQIIGRPSLPNPNPLSRQDVRTAEVVIELDDESAKQAQQMINLQVDVRIHAAEPKVPSSKSDSKATLVEDPSDASQD